MCVCLCGEGGTCIVSVCVWVCAFLLLCVRVSDCYLLAFVLMGACECMYVFVWARAFVRVCV